MPATTSALPSTPSPSSSGFHFPSSIPKKEQPNAHPYAIRTSSTSILSRSNSSSSHASVGAHHYVPTSPSPTAAHHSPTKHHRPSRHRYSRSLTSDAPQPLPPPPAASPSPSPVQAQFTAEPEGDDDTPRRRGQRAETLPSSVGAPTQHLDLPDDPKSWTPSQLCTYLSSTLRAGNANIPAPVAKDIAKFVKERRITGKVFLRLSEDDLIQFGINQLWRTTLLNASRSLRQTILRGRIWGFGNTPAQEEEEEDLGNLSSSSSNLSSSGLAGLKRRSRHSSTASSSSDQGKVKDMVDSFERTSFDEEGTAAEYANGRRSLSPTKLSGKRDSFSSNHHQHSSSSPPKSSRALPHRGTVNNLFSPAPVESEVATEEKEADPTIKHVAKRNVHGREPRLLPFPPNQAPMLTPSHTGAGYALPMSPEHTGSSYIPGASSDYELGFRSPHSQVYVVRHNPASPSNALQADEKKSKRLLPYPPVTAEAQLHHPKPRRLVGTNTGVNELGSEEEGSGGKFVSGTSGTEGYNTALENQSDVESTASNGTLHRRRHRESDEPSMEELLAAEANNVQTPISGVEAWEMELGETVKRIGVDMNPKVNGKRGGGSVAEIGRKAGRNGAGGTMGTRKETDGTKRGGIAGLFGPPPEEPEPVIEQKEEEHIAEEVQGVQERNGNQDGADRRLELRLREQHLEEREEVVARREREVEAREEAVVAQEVTVRARQASDDEHYSTMHRQLQDQASEFEHRERDLEAKERKLEIQEANVARREAELGKKEAEVLDLQKEVEAKDAAFAMRAARENADKALWPLPVDLLRKCWGTFVQPIVGEERTPAFLTTLGTTNPTASTTTTTNGNGVPRGAAPYQTSSWSIKRDILFGRSRRGSYLVLMSIGVCVVALKVLGKRAGGVVGGKK